MTDNNVEMELLQRVTAIETKLDLVLVSDEKMHSSLSERLDKLETAQSKQNTIVLVLGAIGAGVAFGIKYLFGLGDKG